MRIFLFLMCVSTLLADEKCGNEAYFGPTRKWEPCGKLCDSPAEYSVSCPKLCPKYCGNDTYFAPTGRCKPCGKLCDRPAEYPISCKRRCPNYVAKDLPISTTGATSASHSSMSLVTEGFVGLGAVMTVVSLGILMWKKLLKPYFAQLAEQRARKKLILPTQVQNDRTGNGETAPLNEEAFSIDIEDFENEVLNSVTDIYNAHLTEGNDRSDSSDTGVTDTDNSLDENFDFGETIPFHSLPSLKNVF